MTKYTTGTSALPYPEGKDKVAVHGDIQALATATDIAIGTIEGRAGIAATAYTDSVARTLRSHTDSSSADALTRANTYTDTSAQKLRTYADGTGTAALSGANAYTDDQVEGIRDHFSTSHIALDTDGVPYFSPGSMTVQIHQDADGVPYFTSA